MKHATILRALLILEWILIIAGTILSLELESTLPPELQSWLQRESERQINSSDLALLYFGIPLLIAMLVATIALLRLRRWGAWLYLATTVLGIVLLPFTGPSVDHALAAAFDEAGLILSGIVIGIAFFGDALHMDTTAGSIKLT